MPDIQPRKARGKPAQKGPFRWDQDPALLAQSMIQIFGPAAAGKAIERVRLETGAGNRDAAIRWHRIMSLIEEAGRKSK